MRETTDLNNIPNLNHHLLNGLKIFGKMNEIITRIKDTINDQSLIGSLANRGHRPIIINTQAKVKPKFFSDGKLFFMFLEFDIF